VLVAIGLSVEFTGYLTKAFIADAFDKFLHEPVGKATSFSMPGSGRPSWEINLSTAITPRSWSARVIKRRSWKRRLPSPHLDRKAASFGGHFRFSFDQRAQS